MARSTKIRLGAALTLAAMIATVALVQTAFAQETGSETGGTGEKVSFTWADTSDPTSLNPMTGYTATDFYFWTPSYHMLLDYDIDFAVEEPDPAWDGFDSGLATNIEYTDDLLHFTYTIRDDLVWSDGEPLTAEDVAFTMNLYKFNHAYLAAGYLKQIDGEVRVVDETTIEFDTKTPGALYTGENPYMYFYIVPKHVYEDLEKPKQFENVPSVGSGPFVIDEYEVGEFVRMVRNPEWPGPEPYIDEIVYRIYKNDDALATALTTGEVDFAYLDTANIFNRLGTQPNIETMAGTIPSFIEIGFNSGSAYQEADDYFTPHGDGHPALTDKTVRVALRMAISSEELVDKVLLGYGTPGDTIIPPISVPGARWEPPEEERIPFDLEGAAQMLEDAGYVDTDGDGVREMPEGSLEPGRPLEFRYHVRSTDQSSVDAAPFVSEWLADIGIGTEVIAVTGGRLGDIINAGEYDIFSWGWYPDPDPSTQLSYFTCDERPPDGQAYGNNDPYYCNPAYDELYLQQLSEPDPEKRWEIVHEMQRIFYEDAPYAVQWYDPVFSAWRSDRWEGFVVQPQPEGDPLEGWSGPGEVWWSIRPIGAGGGAASETKGIPPAIWAVVAGVIVILAAVFIGRRRKTADEDV
ncbi:MAG TPA: ABC transporter substrate-binding protein [Actinomycetota bacterium]|nr:ABC transporter substrate-binding protein [Actinomycetota bacterium]